MTAPAATPKLWSRGDILALVATGIVLNLMLIGIPGFYAHDELDWRNRIARDDDPWTFGLGSLAESAFFRPLGTLIVSTILRLPSQPLAAHLAHVLIAVATACLVYAAVALFRPDRALAAAILFMLTPGFAYAAGWIAAGFDLQYTAFGVLSILSAILFWRGGGFVWLFVSMASLTVALGCKETALALPVCAALVMVIDRDRIDRRRAAILIAVGAAILSAYLACRFHRLLAVSASGGGGYKFGDARNFFANMVPYFAFPFSTRMLEIGGFRSESAAHAIGSIAPHLVLLGLIVWRGGVAGLFLYLVAFYATLLPVLPISKYETQYAYAGSIVLAIALALVWDRRWFIAVPVAALVVMLVDHAFFIQRSMYEHGVCQTRALDTLKAVLPATAPVDQPAVLISDDVPWWILSRALRDNSFPLRGALVKVSETWDERAAVMVLHGDCSVSLKTAP